MKADLGEIRMLTETTLPLLLRWVQSVFRLIPQAPGIIEATHLREKQFLHLCQFVHRSRRPHPSVRRQSIGSSKPPEVNIPFHHVVFNQLPVALLHRAHPRLGASIVDAVENITGHFLFAHQYRLEAERLEPSSTAHRAGKYSRQPVSHLRCPAPSR